MTVQNSNNVKTYTGNGVTTVFPYDFFIPGDSATDQTNVEVTLLEIATGVEGDPLSDVLWSITGVNTDTFGNVTYTGGGTPLPATHKINIRRVVGYEQNLDLTRQSSFFPELLERQLDLTTYQIQQVAEEVSRAVKVDVGSDLTPSELIETIQQSAEDAATSASAAQTAETNAETAQTAAEAAQAAAEAAAAQAGTGSFATYSWTATAGQTSFTGATATPPLTVAPAGKSACALNLNGRLLLASEFELSGVDFTIDFNDIEAGEILEVKVATSDILNTVSDGAVTLVKLDPGVINSATSKATPVDADELSLWDSVTSTLKKLTWANLKATLKTYFDTLYRSLTASNITYLASLALTSGSSKEWTGIPAWANRVTMHIIDGSTSGTANWLIQIGDATGGFATTGYVGVGQRIGGSATAEGSPTNGVSILAAASTYVVNGKVVFERVEGNLWNIEFQGAVTGVGTLTASSAGRKLLTNPLDRVRLITTDAFDGAAGAVANVSYE